MARNVAPRCIGMKRTESVAKSSKSNGSSTKSGIASKSQISVALCLSNAGCDDLEPRKLYRILPDKKAAADGYLRVVDDSGEDYLYPSKNFAVLRVTAAVAKTLRLVA